MASLTATSVRVAANGTIYVAPSGTTPPANIAAAWTGFTQLGYVTEDGVTMSRNLDTENVTAWQSVSPIRYLVTGVGLTMGFSLLQWDKDTLPLWLGGGSITNQGGGSFKYSISNAPTIDERVLGVEWTDTRSGSTVTNRIIVVRGMVTEGGETTLTRTGAVSLPITFGAMSSDPDLAYVLTSDTTGFS